MYQIDNATAAASRPASTSSGTAGYFTDGDPVLGVEPTILPAEFMNAMMLEILNVLSAAGITPSKNQFNQLYLALLAIASAHSSQAGLATVNVAGNTDVVLSQTQANVSILVLTGSLTGNINVVFPAQAGKWTIINQTTGAYAVTCKTSAGTGVLVGQSRVGSIYGDGTNIAKALTDFNNVDLTGVSTAPTAAPGTNTTQVANTAFVAAAIAALVNSAPGALDTLKELADALGDDANFSTTITNLLAAKAPLNSPTLTGDPKAPTPALGDNDTSIATTAYVLAAITAAGSPPPKYINSATTLIAGKYLVDTSSGPFTVLLPSAPALGDSVEWEDVKGAFDASPLTIDRNGKLIMGIADNLVCNDAGEAYGLWFNGTYWEIY